MIGRRPSQHTKHKCIDRARERERESEQVGRSLVGLFITGAIIQSLVNTEEKLSTNTRTALHGHNQSRKKGLLQPTSKPARAALFYSRYCY